MNRAEIIGYNTLGFEYRTPVAVIDADGVAQLQYLNDPIQTNNITFLYRVTRDSKTNNVLTSEPIDVANIYLMSKRLNDGSKSLSTPIRGLIHYFGFLERINMKWDDMPIRKSNRPTYKYKAALEASYLSQEPEEHLAITTCKNYMNAVVNFYKHYLRIGVRFNEDPFEHELVFVNLKNNYQHMKSSNRKEVHTTDLRLKIGRDRRNDGTSQELFPLSQKEWEEVDKVIRLERKVIANKTGQDRLSPLACEYSLMFLLARYTGLRREEFATLKERHVFKPNQSDKEKGFCSIDIGPSYNSMTKGNVDRTIHIPVSLMNELHSYIGSERYIKRRNKFKAHFGETEPNIFITTSGKTFGLASINARWVEVRNTVSTRLNHYFNPKLHNLRSTFAVEKMKSLLNRGMKPSDTLTYIQDRLGHVNESTTLHYLKLAQGELGGHEIFENILEHLFKDDLDMSLIEGCYEQ